ncbi:MAG: class I SAM-dependent methyltransferase [Elusimicrobiota bacterium]|nr:class I SAM-dependent methyltransferase [Elusimicrobiota bacterium]
MKNCLCPVCGAAAAPAAAGLLKCGACGLVFKTEKDPGPAVYAPGLEEGIYAAAKENLFASALDFLGRVLPRRGRLLDIGCAAGELMKAAAAQGWEADGVELDPSLAHKAAGLGFHVYSRPVEDSFLDSETYNAATVFEVFSQMEDPARAVSEIFRVMRPGGYIYIREFNAAFHLPLYALEMRGVFKPLGLSPSVVHNFNFRAKTLRVMLESAGFRDITVRNSPPTSGDPYRTGGALGGFLTGALKVLYYWLTQALWLITFRRVFAGSTLIATARK